MKEYLPKAAEQDILVQEIADETLVYNMSENVAHCLNQTAAHVWTLCDGESSVKQIAQRLPGHEDFEVKEAVVLLALDQLHSTKLLEPSGVVESGSPSLTRRALIQRLVYAAVAAPVVASVVSPTPAEAQSAVPLACKTCFNSTAAMCASNGCSSVAGRCYANNGLCAADTLGTGGVSSTCSACGNSNFWRAF